jgi:hypothetical protein
MSKMVACFYWLVFCESMINKLVDYFVIGRDLHD